MVRSGVFCSVLNQKSFYLDSKVMGEEFHLPSLDEYDGMIGTQISTSVVFFFYFIIYLGKLGKDFVYEVFIFRVCGF